MQIQYKQEGLALYYGNARAMSAIADGSVNLVASSPPYYNGRDYSQWLTYQDYLGDMLDVLCECWRVLNPADGRIAINVPMGYGRPNSGGYYPIGPDWLSIMVAGGFRLLGVIIWDKTSCETNNSGILGSGWGSWQSAAAPVLRDGYEIIICACRGSHKRAKRGENSIDGETFATATNSLWRIPPAAKSWHPAPWPQEIARRLIELYTFKGDTVLDMFAGSGTTPWTAHALGRNGIGIDANLEYVQQSVTPLLMAIQESPQPAFEFA